MRITMLLALVLLPAAGSGETSGRGAPRTDDRRLPPSFEVLTPMEECVFKALGVEPNTLRAPREELVISNEGPAYMRVRKYYAFEIEAPGSPYNGMEAVALRSFDGPIIRNRRPTSFVLSVIDPGNVSLFSAQASVFYKIRSNTLWTSIFKERTASGQQVFQMVGSDLNAGRLFPPDTRPTYENGAFLDPPEEAQSRNQGISIIYAGPDAMSRHLKAVDCRSGG